MASTRGIIKKSAANPAYRRGLPFKKTNTPPTRGLVSERWRYVAVKRGSQFYITEISPGADGTTTRLFRAPGRRVTFKRNSTVAEKLTQAFASAVKSAP
jgi:hypothetical protein